METAPLGRFFCRRRSGPRAAGKLRHMRTIGQHRTSRDQHATARQCLLQLSDRALRRRRTVRLFDMAKQGLQSRLLVSYRPPACKHPGLVKACDPHDLGGTGQTGIEIIDRGRGHLITCKPSRKAKSEAGRKQSEASRKQSEASRKTKSPPCGGRMRSAIMPTAAIPAILRIIPRPRSATPQRGRSLGTWVRSYWALRPGFQAGKIAGESRWLELDGVQP
jgi:hypothetical protein